MNDRWRRLAEWLGWATPWLTIGVAVVNDLVLGPPCLSFECPDSPHHSSTIIFAFCALVFIIWLAWWLGMKLAQFGSDDEDR